MQSGNEVIKVEAPANVNYTKDVIFSTPFTTTPNVVCSLSDTGQNIQNPYMSPMAYVVTKKGFQAVIKKFEGVDRTATVTFYWIATES